MCSNGGDGNLVRSISCWREDEEEEEAGVSLSSYMSALPLPSRTNTSVAFVLTIGSLITIPFSEGSLILSVGKFLDKLAAGF